MDIHNSCRSCESECIVVCDLGEHPISNRFLQERDSEEELFSFIVTVCKRCGLTQLQSPPNSDSIRPRYPWITYNEPESHLDTFVDIVIKEGLVKPESRIFGTTYKDQSTLQRFKERGIREFINLDLTNSSHVPPLLGIESVPCALTTEYIQKIIVKYGKADLLILRHVLEHTDNLKQFINSLHSLIKESGMLVFEVPDNEKIFRTSDFSYIWEEHCTYFTEKSLKNFLHHIGMNIQLFQRYPYPVEDSLIVVIKKDKEIKHTPDIQLETNTFKNDINTVALRLNRKLASFTTPCYLIGAGHLGIKCVNFFNLSGFFTAAIDDHPQKIGLYLPGSKLKIIPSDIIYQNPDSIYCSGLSPESEAKLIARFPKLVKKKNFFSIFNSSDHSLI